MKGKTDVNQRQERSQTRRIQKRVKRCLEGITRHEMAQCTIQSY